MMKNLSMLPFAFHSMVKKIFLLFGFITLLPFAGWNSTVTYYINSGQLVNMSWTCGSSYYGAGTAWFNPPQGLNWADNQIAGGSTITGVTVEFYVGYDGSGGTYTTKLNGVAAPSFVGVPNGTCNVGQYVGPISLSTAAYVIGGTNTFLVTGTGLWGLYPNFLCSSFAKVTVNFTGAILSPPPTISVTGTPLTGFGTVCINNTTAYQSYNVGGSGLTNNIVVTPPAGYLISQFWWGPFANTPITLVQTCGSVPSTTIYVEFDPTSAGVYNSNITNTSTGATTVNVAVSGTGVNSPPTITSPSSSVVTPTSANFGGNITGIGCGTISERGIYWSTTNGFIPPAGTKIPEPGAWGTGTFSELVSGLSAGTTYYYIAYVTSSSGTAYTTQGTYRYLTGSGGYQKVYTPNLTQYAQTGFYINNSKVISAGPGYWYNPTGYYPNPFIVTDTAGTFIKSLSLTTGNGFGLNRISNFDVDRTVYTGKSYYNPYNEAIVGLLNYTTNTASNMFGYNRRQATFPTRAGECQGADVLKLANGDLGLTGSAFETWDSWSGPSWWSNSCSSTAAGYGYLAAWFGGTSYQRGDDVLLIRTGADGDTATGAGNDGFVKEYSLAYCGGGYIPAQPTPINHATGNFCWSGSPTNMVDSSRAEVGMGMVEAGGNIFICGYTVDYASLLYEGNSFHDMEAFVIKTNSAGAVQWAKTFYIGSTHSAYEEGNAIAAVTSDGSNDVIITMRSQQSLNIELARVANSDGHIVWAKSFSFGSQTRPWSIKQTSNNTFIVGGMKYAGSIGSSDLILLEITRDGTLVQSKGYGTVNPDGSTSWDEIGPIVDQFPGGNYGLSGTTNFSGGATGGSYIIKTNISVAIAGCESNQFITSPSVTDRNSGGGSQLTSRTPIIYEMRSGANKASYAVTTTNITADLASSPICVLPIDLANFDANCKENKVQLTWTTATELNNDYFSIERSADGINFESIAKVTGAGNSSTSRHYEYTDIALPDAATATLYYRLKQTDFNGQSETFSSVSVSCSGNADFSVSVNPNLIGDGKINVAVNTGKYENVLVVVTDVYGQELFSKVLVEDVSSYLFTIDLQGKLAPGVYFVTASNNDNFISKKIVVR